MIGARPCVYACAYVDPVFISQSYDIGISICTRRTNLSVFLVLMLKLMSTQFSLAYTCAYAYITVKLFAAVTLKSVSKTLWCYHSNESSLVGLLHSTVPEVEGLMAVNKSMSISHVGLDILVWHLSLSSFHTQILLSTTYLTLEIVYKSATYQKKKVPRDLVRMNCGQNNWLFVLFVCRRESVSWSPYVSTISSVLRFRGCLWKDCTCIADWERSGI